MMKNTIFLFAAFAAGSFSQAHAQQNDYPYRDVPFTQVHFTDQFLAPRIETVKNKTIPYAFKKCEETGRVDNFAIAGKLKEGKYTTPFPFDDTDVYKIMEGASYLVAVQKDEKLDAYMDSLIYLIGKAQEPDGYLYTTRTINNPLHLWAGEKRWVKERELSHELYNSGHMYEAAVAHYQATGKRSFLDIAIKNANLLCETFGPGKLSVAPGHQVVELALVKLYRVTEDKRYLDLANFFLDARGQYPHYNKNSSSEWENGAYWQDHVPVIRQDEAVGHAVRAVYMYSAMADIAALKQNDDYLNAIDRIWNNVVGKKIYITGGIGSTSHGEAFGKNYELPNKTAYCETCAAIGNCMWNLRMFMLHGDARYIDILERSLYNGVFSGISLDGTKFFYPNVLTCDHNGSSRSEWFDCSCCPSNLSRFIPSIPGYAYATSDNSIYVNLYGSNTATIKMSNGNSVGIKQQTDYPWYGNVNLILSPEKKGPFDLRVRIPGWTQSGVLPSNLYRLRTEQPDTRPEIKVNGKKADYTIEKGYAVLNKKWKTGDRVELSLPMTSRQVVANELVEENRGKVAIERGPIVYCAEFADNTGSIFDYVIDENTHFLPEKADLLNGILLLKGNALYQKMESTGNDTITRDATITLIPYCTRSNRGNGEMSVWLSDGVKNRGNNLSENNKSTE